MLVGFRVWPLVEEISREKGKKKRRRFSSSRQKSPQEKNTPKTTTKKKRKRRCSLASFAERRHKKAALSRSAAAASNLPAAALFSSRLLHRTFSSSAFGDISNSSPLIATAVGSKTTSLADCFQKLSQVNAEIKVSTTPFGRERVKMFLTVGATEEDLRKTLNSMEFSFVEVDKVARYDKISKVRTAKPRHCYRTSDESN